MGGDKKSDAKTEFRFRASPSPTGRVHTGNLRTFLNNYLAARHYGGANVLRVEDTDQNRKVEGGLESIVETLELFGIEFDEGPMQGGDYGPYVQSERVEIYKEHAKRLVESGHAYYCFCSEERLEKLREDQQKSGLKPMYDRECRDIAIEEAGRRMEAGEKCVVRMKFPTTGYMEFVDEIYGKIRVNNKEIDDMILLKSDGFPTYHFAVVVDDHLMKISHVFRGREYLTQTTRDMFLYEAFGWDAPKWVHTPHLLAADGKGKLSKRKGAMAGLAYLRKGYLPEAVLNYLILCGWAPAPEKIHQDEVYTLDEMIELFTIERMHKSNARFDQNKLDYFNGKHIRRFSLDDLADVVVNWAEKFVLGEFIADKFDEPEEWEGPLKAAVEKYLPMWKKDMDYFKKCLELESERVVMLSEIPTALDFFYEDGLNWDNEDWDSIKHERKEIADALESVYPRVVEALKHGKNWSHEDWEAAIRGYADEIGWKHGEVFMSLRIAVTGRKASPPLFECMEILGLEKCGKFVKGAVKVLRGK